MTNHPIPKLSLIATFLAAAGTARADDKPVHPEMWLFDTKPITATAPARGKTAFKITDRIYARVFYDRPIRDVFELTPEKYGIKVYQKLVDSGSVYDQVDIWISKKDFGNKWIDLEILPDPATARTKFGEYGRPFHYTWTGHDDLQGAHQVYYDMMTTPNDKDARAAIITIDFTGLDVKALEAEAEKVTASGNKAFSSNFGLPKPGRLHSGKLAKATEAMTRRGNHDLKAVKVIYTGDDWDIERNDLTGRILARVAEAAVVMKDKDGTCLLDTGLIRQQYVGGKFRGPGEWANTATTAQQIDCGKAFK